MNQIHGDNADKAADYTERMVQAGIAAAQNTPTIAATGTCLECGEPQPHDRRWCDADCRDTWEQRRAA